MSEMIYTISEVAAALGVCKESVYKLVHSGRLPAVRVGRLYRVPRAQLEEWLEREAAPKTREKDPACY